MGWESPKRFLLRQHIPGGRKGRALGLPRLPLLAPRDAVGCRRFLRFLPSLCKVQAKMWHQRWSCSPAPLTGELPTHPYRSGIYLFSSRVSWFYLLGRNAVLGRAQLERVSASVLAAHRAGGGWLPGFPGDTQLGGDRDESLPFSSWLCPS